MNVLRTLKVVISRLDHVERADAIEELFRDIAGLGVIKTQACNEANTRVYQVETTSSNEDLLDLFAFHVSRFSGG